ncbi:MAG: hypothetical protein ACFBQW_05930 [Sphingomonadaceae bacterium]
MSRPALVFLLLLVLVLGGAVYLAGIDTEIPPQRIEQDITDEALAE